MTGMVYTRGTTTVVQRGYSYDALGRPLTRTQSRQGGTRNDSFTHNDRSELTAATLGTDAYAYAYDNIGNRLTAQEAEEQTAYTANNLNQYTAIQEGEAEAFAPTYDADGNQTLVKTSTGIWAVSYNAVNRPVVFANEATGTVVECSYDSSGRRATKKVTVNGTVTLHQRYIYRGYLQIACCDLTRTAHPCLWLITWDPMQPIATRPLAIQKDGTWYTYGFDLTKNVTEVFTTTGYIGTAYTYTPYGEVSASGNITQPIQWSSEYHDVELGLVYYNYRHYNPEEGRWLRRDPMGEAGGANLCCYVRNNFKLLDYLGLKSDSGSSQSCPIARVEIHLYQEEKISSAGLEKIDADNRELWNAFVESGEMPKNGIHDPALVEEFVDTTYPIANPEKTILKPGRVKSRKGYWGSIWTGDLILHYSEKCNTVPFRKYSVQSGGRASGFEGSESNGTTAPVSGKGSVDPEIKQEWGTIRGYRIYNEINKEKTVWKWTDDRTALLIHLAPLFVPAYTDKQGKHKAEIRQTGSHGCVSLLDLQSWYDLEKEFGQCAQQKPVTPIPLLIRREKKK